MAFGNLINSSQSPLIFIIELIPHYLADFPTANRHTLFSEVQWIKFAICSLANSQMVGAGDFVILMQ